MVKRPIIMKGKKVSLGILIEEDAEFLYENINNPDIRKYLYTYRFYTLDNEREFIKRQVGEEKSGNSYTFAIIENTSGKIYGVITLNINDIVSKIGILGYWLAKEYWNKGYTTEAVTLILKFAKESLNLRKIIASAFGENIGSQRVLEKNGFRRIGEYKEHIWTNGKYQDEVMFEKFLD